MSSRRVLSLGLAFLIPITGGRVGYFVYTWPSSQPVADRSRPFVPPQQPKSIVPSVRRQGTVGVQDRGNARG